MVTWYLVLPFITVNCTLSWWETALFPYSVPFSFRATLRSVSLPPDAR